MQGRFSTNKPKKNLSLRLTTLPSVRDLEYVFNEAQKYGQPAEVTFSKNGECFFVVGRYEKRDGSFTWTFKRGTEQSSTIEWVHESKDLTLISTLILTAFPDETMVSDASQETGFYIPPIEADPQQKPASDSAPPPPEGGALQGDLTKIPVETLLQSISSGKMTGRLEIRDKAKAAEIYFKEGLATHATAQDLEGEQAVVELIACWPTGQFWFISDQLSEKITITKRLDNLLMCAATLMDHSQFLEKQGLKLESHLVWAFQTLTEQDFEVRLKAAVPVDMNLQKKIYQSIGGSSTLLDVLRITPLNKSEWTPIMFNLISTGLIIIDNQQQPQKQASEAADTESDIDTAALEKFVAGLKRADTGLFTPMPFLFLLEQELNRFQVYQIPFAIVLVRLARYSGGAVEPLTGSALKEAINRLERCRRPTDVLAHFETFDIAMLLPHTNLQSARGFVGRLVEVIYSAPLVQGMEASELSISMGVGAVPDDGIDLRMLLKTARQRRDTRP